MVNDKIRVHIADDHKILIDGLVALLKTDLSIAVVGHSLTGKQVINAYSEDQVDILVLDINMPELDGIGVLKTFQNRNVNHKTIILSSHNDPKLVQELMSLGASGFVEKSSASEFIIEAIKKVYNGELYYSEDIKNNLLNLYVNNSKNDEFIKTTVDANLSDREVEVLKLIAQEKSTQEIADKLFISVKTVESDRRKLYKKIKVKNMVGLAMYAVKNNIV